MRTLQLETFALGILEVSLVQLGKVKRKIAKAAKRESKARQGISNDFRIWCELILRVCGHVNIWARFISFPLIDRGRG